MRQQNIKNIFMFMFLLWGKVAVISHDNKPPQITKESNIIFNYQIKKSLCDDYLNDLRYAADIIEIKNNKLSLKHINDIDKDENYKFKSLLKFIIYYKMNKIIQKDPFFLENNIDKILSNIHIDHPLYKKENIMNLLHDNQIFHSFLNKDYSGVVPLYSLLKEDGEFFGDLFEQFDAKDFIFNLFFDCIYEKLKKGNDISAILDDHVLIEESVDNADGSWYTKTIYENKTKSAAQLFEEFRKLLEQEMKKIIEEDGIKIQIDHGKKILLWEDKYEKKTIYYLGGGIYTEQIITPFVDKTYMEYDPNQKDLEAKLQEQLKVKDDQLNRQHDQLIRANKQLKELQDQMSSKASNDPKAPILPNENQNRQTQLDKDNDGIPEENNYGVIKYPIVFGTGASSPTLIKEGYKKYKKNQSKKNLKNQLKSSPLESENQSSNQDNDIKKKISIDIKSNQTHNKEK